MLGQREVTFELIYPRKYADTFLDSREVPMSLLKASRDIEGFSLVGKGSTNANSMNQLDYSVSGRMQKSSVFFKVLCFLLTDF